MGGSMQRPVTALLMAFSGLAMMIAGVSTGHAQCSSDNCSRIRVEVAAAPGAVTDGVIRLVATPIARQLDNIARRPNSWQVIVENRPGGGGAIAVEAVVRAPTGPNDEKILLATDASTAIGSVLLPGRHNVASDLVAVAGIVRLPYVMVVNPMLPVRTLAEFIDYVRNNPGRISMASTGIGSLSHMSAELLKSMARLEMVHVPYRGGAPAMQDVLAGQVGGAFLPVATVLGQIRAGTLKPLAVTSAERVTLLPEVPTISSVLQGYEATGWVGLSTAKGAAPEVIASIQQAVRAVLSDREIQSRLSELGGVPFQDSPDVFARLVAGDIEKWGSVARAANIRVQ
jgi:tripartite-type tricarboxylate transporter receptor subunit TctC